MSGPRNRPGKARGDALRQQICALLEKQSPLAAPLKAREIHTRLNCPQAVRTVQWHLQQIRCAARNLSTPTDAP